MSICRCKLDNLSKIMRIIHEDGDNGTLASNGSVCRCKLYDLLNITKVRWKGSGKRTKTSWSEQHAVHGALSHILYKGMSI